MESINMEFNKLTFTSSGEEQSYTIPEGTRSIALKVSTGSVDMRKETGTSADEWPMSAGEPEAINDDVVCGETLYFTSTAAAATLHIRRVTQGV